MAYGHSLFFFFALLLSLVPWSHSFYGAVPQDFMNKGDTLEVKVNKLSSIKTQLPSINTTIPSVTASLHVHGILLAISGHRSIYVLLFWLPLHSLCYPFSHLFRDGNSTPRPRLPLEVEMFSYSIFYFLTMLEIEKFVSVIPYFGYMLIGSFAFFLLMGRGQCVSTHASGLSGRSIYSSVKFD